MRVLIMIALAILTFGSTGEAPAADLKIRMGYQPGTAPRFYVARDQKLFEKNGLAPEYLKFIAGPPMLSALETGHLDVAFMTTAPTIFGLAQGVDVRVFFVESDAHKTIALISTPRSGMRGFKDQRGKRIGVSFGTSAHYAVLKSLEVARVPTSEVTMVDMAASVILPAFIKGDIDGGWAWDPWTAKMEQEGGTNVGGLYEMKLSMPGVWLVRTKWLEANPEGVQRFLKAMDLADAAMKANPDQAIATMSDVVRSQACPAEALARVHG